MVELAKRTFAEWRSDDVGVLASSLAYFAMLSMAPMLIVVSAVATLLGRGDAQAAIMERIRGVAGENAAQLVRSMIENREAAGGDIVATLVGSGLVLVGATGVGAQLRTALNVVWNVKVDPERPGPFQAVRVRARSLLLILGAGVLLFVTLVGTAVLRSATAAARDEVPYVGLLWTVLDPAILIVGSGLVFALVFRFLPNVRVPWRTVVVGGLVTAVLFVAGNWLLGLYLSRAAVATSYGAAGALVAILLWVFVSAHVVVLGAEFTKVFGRRSGDRIVAGERAVPRRR